MKKHLFFLPNILIIILCQVYADTLFTSIELGYTSYLPDNWVCEIKDSTQHYFYDTTGTYGALLSIVRYPMDKTMYPTPEEWTLSHFIAYSMYMDYYPFGTVLFSDSSETERQGDYRATEIYLRFYTDDTLDYSWDEYIRYTATENYGYELYVIGDTADVMVNIGYYGAILKMISIEEITPVIVNNSQPIQKNHYIDMRLLPYGAYPLYSVQGRRISVPTLQKNSISHGMYIYNRKKINTISILK